MNDNTTGQVPPPVEPLRFVLCVALNCVLSSFLFGAPFAVLYSNRFLPNPASKMASILGIGSAAVLFGSPAPVLIVILVASFVFTDCVEREMPLGPILFRSVLATVVASASVVSVFSYIVGSSIFDYWVQISQSLSTQLEAYLDPNLFNKTVLLMFFQYQAPFLLVGVTLLALWFAIGIGAHLSWFCSPHPLSGAELRRQKFGPWVLVGLILSSGGRLLFSSGATPVLLAGIETIFLAMLFCQGCIAFSNLLVKRVITRGARTLWYIVFSSIGFYLSVVLGIVWLLKPAFISLRRVKNESHPA